MRTCVKKFISHLLVMMLMFTIFPIETIYAETAECVFYDDFENGDVFWNYGSYRNMRIIDGKLTSDVKDSVCSVSLAGETTKWDNFVMETIFETDENDGFFRMYIRTGTEEQIQLLIHKGGFYTIPSPVSGGSCEYQFENGKQYLMRITAQNETINVQIKAVEETQFSGSWIGQYASSGEGGISFDSYLAKVRIDSIKITQQLNEKAYYENKFIKVPQGGSVSAVPIITEDYDSISYSCSGDSFTVDSEGTVTATESGSGYGVLTATIVSGENTYTARCDLARTVPVVSLGYSDKFYKMNVGDTKNIKVNIQPANATNKELTWETDNPDAIELIGDTEAGIGVRALAPAKNVRIIARAKENPGITYAEYITVEGRPSEIKVQEFNLNGKIREIPNGMLGMSMMMPLNSAATREELIEYDTRHLPYMREMKLQQLRMCFENYDCTIGNIAGTDRGYAYSVADIFSVANELDVPINISLNEYYDSAEKIITLAEEIRKVTDKEICFGIWEECYDGRMENYSGWSVKTAYDYTDFLKEIYPKIKTAFPDGGVKIGATVLDYPTYLASGNGVGTSMLSTWNDCVAEAKDYYDAVVIHNYSGTDSDTKGVMEGFAVSSALLNEGIDIQTEMFEGKEFWLNEWGDLPTQIFSESLQSTQARNQYMKSLGNAIGYLQKFLEMTENEAVKMSAYHVYLDSMGFGTLQEVDDTIYKLPPYYMFSMIGDIFENNSHIYSLDYSEDNDLHYAKDVSVRHNVSEGTYIINASLINGWAFGDESGIKEAVFENASEYYVKAYIPNYVLKKVMSYGNGENPLPDLGVNDGDKMADLPSYIPVPEFYENENYEDYILIPPYSVYRTEVLPRKMQWITAFEDDFSDGTLNKWSSTGEFENINSAMAVNVFNQTILPEPAPASENISISFELQDYMDNMYVKFYNSENPDDYFLVRANDKLSWDVTQVWDGKHDGAEYWHNFGSGISASGTKSIKYEIKNGVLTQYMKDADGNEYATGTYSYEEPGHYIKKDVKYSVGFYCIGEQNSAEGYNKEKAEIDNVEIKTLVEIKPFEEIEGTEKISPVYETVFEDDFSSGTEKWTGNTESCRVTEEGLLAIDGYNTLITPDAVISSETIEVEYDCYGKPNFMVLEFYNTENPLDKFRLVCHDKTFNNTSEITDFGDTWHKFGSGIVSDKWQTLKFVLNDGLIEMYVKDSDEPEFIERDHRVGIPYSSVWYDADDNNVSLMKKGVKYGVRIYMYKHDENSDPTFIDNFKVRAVSTETSESAYIGGVKQFELTDIRIEVETDSGYELTSNPVCGAANKFTLTAEGGNVGGIAIFAVYEGEKLVNIATTEIKETTEAEVYIPTGATVKLMLWENLQECCPMTDVMNY